MSQPTNTSNEIEARAFYLKQHNPRFAEQLSRVLNTLSSQYILSKPQATSNEFRNDVYHELLKILSPLSIGEELDLIKVRELIEIRHPKILESDLGWIYISCAFALASAFCFSERNNDRAWKFLCEAHYYCGFAASTDRDREIYTAVVASGLQQSLATQGGISKNSRYKKYQNRTEEIFKTRGWPSLNKAVLTITETLKREFAQDEEVRKAGGYQFTSVKDWIKELPSEILDAHIPSYTQRKIKSQDVLNKLKASSA